MLTDGFVQMLLFGREPEREVVGVRRWTNLVFSWSTNVASYQLEATFDLTPPASWSTVSTNPPILGDHYEVAVPLPATPTFFRLVQP